MLDYVIRGGSVVDGTGSPAVKADVGIEGGRIVEVGKIKDDGSKTVDASGLVVAPGFIDLHTHYDVQLHWDPLASPSLMHGVTTVVGGNCGFTLAPVLESGHDYLAKMMARVEGMPLAALEACLSWKWERFGEFLNKLEGHVAVNAGFLAGHSAIRRMVMGDGAVESASADEVEAMAKLLRQCMEEGALGFSTSRSTTHRDANGDPVPSRAADDHELVRLSSVTHEFDRASIAMIPTGAMTLIDSDEARLMIEMSVAAGHTLNWNTVSVDAKDPERHQLQMAVSRLARESQARVVALSSPYLLRLRLSFLTGFVFDTLPGWPELLFDLSAEDRIVALRNPEVRRRLKEGAARGAGPLLQELNRWTTLEFVETFQPDTANLVGRTVGSVAAERRLDPFDLLLDIVAADKLRTGLYLPAHGSDDESWRLRAELWKNPDVVFGGSDAGAHLDVMCGGVLSTALLADVVRDKQLLTLESAVRQITDIPAQLYSFEGRGRVQKGYWGDLVLFDPETVGYGPTHLRNDLPGGAERLYADAKGVHRVFVNGREVLTDSKPTGDLPGQVLRSKPRGQSAKKRSTRTPEQQKGRK